MSDPLARAKALRKEEKAMMKALETPEEKRLRRLAKKDAKEKKRKQLLGCEDYTNRDNPFGDDNLEATFIWKKKYEREGREVDEKEIVRENKKKLEETRRELELVKQRRLQREKEYEERQEELGRIQREKEMAQFEEFEKQEDTFHLKQAKLRSKIRSREGRAKPIDLLSQYYDAFTLPGPNDPPKTEDEIEDEEKFLLSDIREPYDVLNGLRRSDLEDLIEDIKVYMELEKDRDLSFWKDMTVIVEDELTKLRNYREASDRRDGIHSSVVSSVNELFKGKTAAQLQTLKNQVETRINSREKGLDVTYWETVLSKLKAVIAKARLKDLHEQNLVLVKERLKLIGPRSEKHSASSSRSEERHSHHHQSRYKDKRSYHDRDRDHGRSSTHDKRSDEIKIKQERMSPEAGPSSRETDNSAAVEVGREDVTREDDDEDTAPQENEEAPEISLIQQCKEAYVEGRYSPPLIPFDSKELVSVRILDPEEDERLRYFKKSNRPSSTVTSAADAAFDTEARKGMSRDEVQFSVEEAVKQDRSVLAWSEKYKPRKPRYFNRVHTGFEWNKYNQTHYDIDNPPPKIVQGYKFNLFYPDLIDKSKTPKYTITPCPDNREFATIRFTAGPPYEDIAFKIVNREWNYSYRSGFRSQFINGILQLWFHFKRYRYRR